MISRILSSLKTDHESALTDLKSYHDSAFADLKAYHNSAFADLKAHHDSALTTAVETLAAHSKDLSIEHGKELDARNKRAAAFFDKAFVAQQAHQRTLETKVTSLETKINSLEKSDKFLIERFNSLTYAVEDLLERENDPNALGK